MGQDRDTNWSEEDRQPGGVGRLAAKSDRSLAGGAGNVATGENTPAQSRKVTLLNFDKVYV